MLGAEVFARLNARVRQWERQRWGNACKTSVAPSGVGTDDGTSTVVSFTLPAIFSSGVSLTVCAAYGVQPWHRLTYQHPKP